MPFATHILVPTDFSTAALLAVEAGAMLATEQRAKLTILHVHDPEVLRSPSGFGARGDRDALGDEIENSVHTALAELRERKLAGVADLDLVILHDASAANAICKYAQKAAVDLIVMATHGRTGLRQLLIGSVAERVVRHAHCPVLSLRSKAED